MSRANSRLPFQIADANRRVGDNEFDTNEVEEEEIVVKIKEKKTEKKKEVRV